MLALTPENLANFIGARGYDAKKIVITDVLDRLIVNTCMGMLDVCRTRNYVGELLSIWRRSSWERRRLEIFGGGTQCVADEYFAMEDEAVTMAECQML